MGMGLGWDPWRSSWGDGEPGCERRAEPSEGRVGERRAKGGEQRRNWLCAGGAWPDWPGSGAVLKGEQKINCRKGGKSVLFSAGWSRARFCVQHGEGRLWEVRWDGGVWAEQNGIGGAAGRASILKSEMLLRSSGGEKTIPWAGSWLQGPEAHLSPWSPDLWKNILTLF